MMKPWKATCMLAAAGLLGCGGENAMQPGRFSLAVTDAPVDSAEAVWVSFTRVELLQADPGNAEADLSVLDLALDGVAVNLLDLQGERSRFLVEEVSVAPGVYKEIRLSIDAAEQSCRNPNGNAPSYITIDGTDYPLTATGSSFKIKGPVTIAAGGLTSFTVDFDLRKSIAERGNNGCYNLRPVLRAVDNAQIGSLRGTIEGSLLADSSCSADPQSGEGAAIYLFSEAGVVADDVDEVEPNPLSSALLQAVLDPSSQEPTGDFSYTLGFLLAGEYTAALTCTAGDDDPDLDDASVSFLQQFDVNIVANQTSEQNFVQPAMNP